MCVSSLALLFFFFHAPAPTYIYTLSLHDALPISWDQPLDVRLVQAQHSRAVERHLPHEGHEGVLNGLERTVVVDRKSTRLNSSHTVISYAVFCLKKKKTKKTNKTEHDHQT